MWSDTQYNKLYKFNCSLRLDDSLTKLQRALQIDTAKIILKSF